MIPRNYQSPKASSIFTQQMPFSSRWAVFVFIHTSRFCNGKNLQYSLEPCQGNTYLFQGKFWHQQITKKSSLKQFLNTSFLQRTWNSFKGHPTSVILAVEYKKDHEFFSFMYACPLTIELCSFSFKGRYGVYFSTPWIWVGHFYYQFGQRIYQFGQRIVSKYDASRPLKRVCTMGLFFLLFLETLRPSPCGLG